MLTGGCFCGAVRYETDGPAFHESICHCDSCRRTVGAASVAWFTVPRASLRFTGADPKGFKSSAAVIRRFCGNCGTSLTFESEAHPDEVDLTVCSLDDPDAAAPRDHVHAAEKLGWTRLCDGLPAYPGSRSAAMGGTCGPGPAIPSASDPGSGSGVTT